ncbi:MAG: NAD(P)H-dependent flavin oxidoreductase [Acidimicrobiia bacterium]
MGPDDRRSAVPSRLTGMLGIELPIVQAPMANSSGVELAVTVCEAGGLGSLPCAMLTPDQVREQVALVREQTSRPVNVNFFSHAPADDDPAALDVWQQRLAAYYEELGTSASTPARAANRAPFDEAMCELVEELRPEVVSFHFGLPEASLVDRVRATGATVLSSATSVREARWLEHHGCDVIIAQGAEAGGHRGIFLSDDVSTQVGTMALVPQVVDAVSVPVVAAGGIADARGIAAAFALGAEGVQLGTAFLLCPEAMTSPLHRQALRGTTDDGSAITNVFTGRPARSIVNRAVREVGPMSDVAPHFPLAAAAIAPLRQAAEETGSADFSPLWSGQAATLSREMPAGELTQLLAEEADRLLRMLAASVRGE